VDRDEHRLSYSGEDGCGSLQHEAKAWSRVNSLESSFGRNVGLVGCACGGLGGRWPSDAIAAVLYCYVFSSLVSQLIQATVQCSSGGGRGAGGGSIVCEISIEAWVSTVLEILDWCWDNCWPQGATPNLAHAPRIPVMLWHNGYVAELTSLYPSPNYNNQNLT